VHRIIAAATTISAEARQRAAKLASKRVIKIALRTACLRKTSTDWLSLNGRLAAPASRLTVEMLAAPTI
jgi:hypothetical protein